MIRKPVVSTKDVRFFEVEPPVEILPDGHPRRGMSVVSALSAELVHTNSRRDETWTQTYRFGIPDAGLTLVDEGRQTGTAVAFSIEQPVAASTMEMIRVMVPQFPHLEVTVEHE